jgi:hypothetical protein
MAPRRTVAHLLLVLALLLTQQVLTAHPFAHRAGAADTQDDQSAPGHRIWCALCVAGAAASSALPSAGHPPFASVAEVFEPAPITWAYRPLLTRAFSARAPPTLL